MGKAFTEEEKEQIKTKLMDAAIVRFKEKGLKKVSIRELTQAAGIAQGGFYSFFDSKETLLAALVNKRISEKAQVLIEHLPEIPENTLHDPVKFISDQLYATGMHLKDNLIFNNIISDSMKILLGDNENLELNIVISIKTALIQMISYWKQHGITVTVDTKGLRGLVKAAAVLFMNVDIIGAEVFPDLYYSFVTENTKRYIKADGQFLP